MEETQEQKTEGKVVLFEVGMTCEGCSGAVKRILGRIDGVSSVEADIEAKKVTVNCREDISEEDLLAALKKWGDAAGKSVALVV